MRIRRNEDCRYLLYLHCSSSSSSCRRGRGKNEQRCFFALSFLLSVIGLSIYLWMCLFFIACICTNTHIRIHNEIKWPQGTHIMEKLLDNEIYTLHSQTHTHTHPEYETVRMRTMCVVEENTALKFVEGKSSNLGL